MKRKALLVASLVVALVLGMGIIPAGAYFTDSDTANGGVEVTVTPTTDIQEWIKEGVKHVVISNSEEATTAVYVRVGVFTSLKVDISGTGWSGPVGPNWVGPAGNGWFVYDQILEPGDKTDNELLVDITFPEVKSDEKPDGAVEGDNANVIVLYESTPVLYDTNGNPYADWSLTANKAPEGGN